MCVKNLNQSLASDVPHVFISLSTLAIDPSENHIAAISAIELINERFTVRQLYAQLSTPSNSGASMREVAREIDGLKSTSNYGQPNFGQIGEAFVELIREAVLICHNGKWCLPMLDAKLRRNGFDELGDLTSKMVDIQSLVKPASTMLSVAKKNICFFLENNPKPWSENTSLLQARATGE